MGLENCQIIFDNVNATYFPGQVVTGKVEFNFNSAKKIRGISISFKGEAQVHWSESESYRDSDGKNRSRSVSYNGNEEYFSSKYYVQGGGSNDSETLPAGKHIFPFTTTLPNFLPSSFESDRGYIRYTVKATLDRPWKFDQTIKAAFTVISHLDCNNDPRAREPATLTMEKNLCCLCCREGPITAILKIPCTGYVSGQVIPYVMEVDNTSRTDVGEIKLKLKKKVTYHSQFPRAKSKSNDVTITDFVVGERVTAQDSKTFSNSFTLPSLPPSNLQNCRIIDLEYELKVQVEIEGFHQNLIGNIPITIGTIPLRNMVPVTPSPEETSVQQPVFGWIPAPSDTHSPSAPVDPFLLPPPTYEECQFGTKSIMDQSDSEYTRFNNGKSYAPSYPVYNFHALPVAPPLESSNLPLPMPTPTKLQEKC